MITIYRFTMSILLGFFLVLQTGMAQKTDELFCAYNGFLMENLEIPITAIFQGGPAKDGVPSLQQPAFIAADQADYLHDQDQVIGLEIDGITKAYPIRVLNYHEVVNDRIGDYPIVVTYSPLCASGVAYSAKAGGENLRFGVSGLVYNNNLLFYDWETESLWAQLTGKSVAGQASGSGLEQLPSTHTTWGAWKRNHPQTLVLSADTGYDRNYSKDPYTLFGPKSGRLMFPVDYKDKKLPLKEKVMGIQIDGEYRAYPLALLTNAARKPIHDELNGVKLKITFDALARSAQITDLDGRIVPAVTTYWFSWYAFHPETDIYGFLPEQSNLAMDFLMGGK